MDLEPVGTVFERIVDANGFGGQLAGLAHGNEADSERERHRRAKDEPPRFHARDRFGPSLARAIRQPGDGGGEAGAVADKGGNIAKLDPWRRKVRHRAHQGLQCLGIETGGQPFFLGFIAAQTCCFDI